MKTLLLHVCCGPCASYVIEFLKGKYDLTLYFFNPNIEPEEEYLRRLESVKKLADKHNLLLIEGKYNNNEWREFVKGFENEPEGGKRCSLCFAFRLKRTAELADELGFDFFTTTLTISSYKDADVINKIGKKYDKYLEFDFSKGFSRSVELAKEYNLYRQKYCGCEFSNETK